MTLKCDFDGRFPRTWLARLGFIARQFGYRVRWTRIDRTAHGWHLTAQLARKRVGVSSPWETTDTEAALTIVLMQALMGSDWKRELFNGVRAVRMNGAPAFWVKRFNQLFTNHHRSVVI